MSAKTDDRLQALLWPAFENRTGNPYNRLLAEGLEELGVAITEFKPRRLLFGRYDVWHMHWPEGLLGTTRGLRSFVGKVALDVFMRYARRRGIRAVWTVHNLEVHDGPLVADSNFWKAFTEKIDASIHLSETGRLLAMDRFPALKEKPSFMIPHGHYRTVYPNTLNREEARKRLGLSSEEHAIVHVGYGRPYKNIPHLIRTFCALDAPSARLIVAGKPSSGDLRKSIQTASSNDQRVRLELEFVPADQIQVYLNAADLVVLPYSRILNSGSALLALSLNRPVLVPNVGAMGELQTFIGANWVHTYDGELTAEDLASALSSVMQCGPMGPAPLDHLDWSRLAAQTLAAYRSVCGAV